MAWWETAREWIKGWQPKDALSIMIAGLALIFSVYSTTYTFRSKQAEELRDLRFQMNQAILQIIETNSENFRHWQDAYKNNVLHEWQLTSSIVNQKLATLGRLFLYLDAQAGQAASDIEYATVAGALASVGDPMADNLWRRAIEAASDPLYRLYNTRGYADYLFNVGRLKEGRDVYRECLNILKGNDDFTKYTDGYTHRMWAVSERTAGAEAEAEIQFQNARELFEQIQRGMMRDSALQDLYFVRQHRLPQLPPEIAQPPGELPAATLRAGK